MKRIFTVLLLASIVLVSCKKEYAKEIVVEKLAETSSSWNGDALPSYATGKPKVTVLKITIPPKTKLKWHKHLVINSGILLKGALKVVDESGEELFLNEGDVIVELVNTYHYGINEQDVPAEIVVFYSGTVGVPITVLKDDSTHEGH